MGEQLLRSFPCIDVVSRGEADETFVDVLDQLFHGGAPTRRRESLTRDADDAWLGLRRAPRHPARARLRRVLRRASRRSLDIPTPHSCSRPPRAAGGVNGGTAPSVVSTARRWRSAASRPQRARRRDRRMLPTLRHARRSASSTTSSTRRYIDTLFPELAATGLDLDIFFEVKANLHRRRARSPARRRRPPNPTRDREPERRRPSSDAQGRDRVPEHPAAAVGSRARHHVLVEHHLRLSRRTAGGVRRGWPALLPSLDHLPPPGSSARVRLDRFSPFHVDPAEHGFSRVRPSACVLLRLPVRPSRARTGSRTTSTTTTTTAGMSTATTEPSPRPCGSGGSAGRRSDGPARARSRRRW